MDADSKWISLSRLEPIVAEENRHLAGGVEGMQLGPNRNGKDW
jgi:hypothetical protein